MEVKTLPWKKINVHGNVDGSERVLTSMEYYFYVVCTSME